MAREPEAVGSRPPRVDFIVADARRALVESVLIEIETAQTLLDVAARTADREHAERTTNTAITALRSADRLLSCLELSNSHLSQIRRRRDQLARRLPVIVNQ